MRSEIEPALLSDTTQKKVEKSSMAEQDIPLSPASTQTIQFAREEALQLQHTYVGTEHLLLGLLRNETSPGAVILTSLGLTLSRVRQSVELIIGKGVAPVLTEVTISSRAKQVLNYARQEAAARQQTTVETTHILLGLIHESAGDDLSEGGDNLGVALGKIRTEALWGADLHAVWEATQKTLAPS